MHQNQDECLYNILVPLICVYRLFKERMLFFSHIILSCIGKKDDGMAFDVAL